MNYDEDGRIRAKLLYVEDDDLSRFSFKAAYSKDFQIDVAQTYDEAMELAQKNNYDAFIVDINLGASKNGLLFSQKAKELPQYKDTPFIALTAFAGRNYEKEFLSKGITHYFAKPMHVDVFTSYIKKILGIEEKDFTKTHEG